MLTLKVDPVKCDGCGRCAVACQVGHAFSNGGRDPGSAAPLLWIRQAGESKRIDICRHCETPVCADACVAGAIYCDKNSGTVQVAAEKCIGCYSCVMECPFSTLRLPEGIAVKCDGCRFLQGPLCVKHCPTGALQAAADSKAAAARRRRGRAVLTGRAR
jgi:carbon-monoxide dehydrogenase iron sulfur subunit